MNDYSGDAGHSSPQRQRPNLLLLLGITVLSLVIAAGVMVLTVL